MMLAPLALVLGTELVGYVLRNRADERALRQKRQLSRGRSAASRASYSVAMLAVEARESTFKALPFALRLSFLAFPAISSLVSSPFGGLGYISLTFWGSGNLVFG